ncbi:hypothetical protein RF11_08468 [Thelohanellus kitauei]|uniref:Uncharacterized protein n=1 Tax=Thelohanellus kitauei TaxID=669202 RepID=A0A0C2M2I7_THEKT|nr:hypothetical protein RF11_08468 [Thelohanellus kitauei]
MNVVVVGNIGLTENESPIKKLIANRIALSHYCVPFQLGINLGNTVLPNGCPKNDFQKLQERFSFSFPSNIFTFDILSIIGPRDHDGDFETEINYHRKVHPQFYLPKRNYVYGWH